MLDALFERNVSKQYQVEITPDGADPKSFQHDLHLGLERYTAAITEAVGVLEKQRATALSQTTRLRDQISKFESSAVENSLTDSKMGHVEVELQKISADRKYLQEKLSNLERRKNEIAKRRIEIRTIQSDFKAQVCDQSALGVSYTEDILEDFLKQYRSTLLMQINELRELKSLSLKKSAMLNGVEEKFEFVHSATERYNLLADVPVKIRITHVLDNDLGKSAKSLTGRTLFEIQKELEQAIIYHNNQIERLRVKIIKQDKAREALETTHGPIINEKLKMSEKLQHKRCNIEANRCSLENDRVLLAKWVGEVEEENARSLSSTSEKETNAHSDVDKAKICFDKERMENLATISPLEDRLIDRYDEFSRVYNQIGASFNGMLTSSTQVVKSTEEDIRLSNFKNPLQFTCDFNVTENLFSQYSSVLSSRANHA
ncbi:hypothetical protein B9G98_01054 [Wickerhamiella sorbophila]|uniref:Uncharacterized protein n=1 Tax=Wickerhamiella sorbophila TaxID=45607 RepID=A0A2T0FEM5_9ASCO|nr:hypothetical protein B9G98_01054 [Wickerhamiella sorbophila]PRT53434.1 hypothetical protein B9G98_01054 [Wickerhamiella sorbophila]